MSSSQSKFIRPTIGRKVWFWNWAPTIDTTQPEDATICYVHDDSTVNLRVTDHNGDSHPEHFVHLIPSNAEKQTLDLGLYATWMPYQIGQSQAEKALGGEEQAKILAPQQPLKVLPVPSPLPKV